MLVSRETIYPRAPFSISDNGCLGVGVGFSLMWLLISATLKSSNHSRVTLSRAAGFKIVFRKCAAGLDNFQAVEWTIMS